MQQKIKVVRKLTENLAGHNKTQINENKNIPNRFKNEKKYGDL